MQPLAGIKVVEVSMWAYVPSCGAVLADWGASVVKVEPPDGDPIRGLSYAGVPPSGPGVTFMSELFNRGKQSVCLDLQVEAAREILLKMIDDADVFLVSLLPKARRQFGIDADAVRARNPRIIYAFGSGQGSAGDEGERGGYDSISFWARGGISDALTPVDVELPIMMPTGAFGDVLSGLTLAGGIAAAIAHRERTGEGSVVEGSLLGTAMWGMQAGIVAAGLLGVEATGKLNRDFAPNPIVFPYRTSDDRFVALNMLQADRFWPGLCEVMERPDLITDPRFVTAADRATNIKECFRILDEIFASKTLAEWRVILDRQPGQWDVVKKAGEVRTDPQALANGFIQSVDCGEGRQLEMVASPLQFDRQPPPLRAAPLLGAHTDQVLSALGLTDEEILEAKIKGAVG
jgi:crotonobetainyl-CoA:carnitine CoA-transferase CaiB-like acyl-CoA transferase